MNIAGIVRSAAALRLSLAGRKDAWRFPVFCGEGCRPGSGEKNVQILNIVWTDAVYYLTWI